MLTTILLVVSIRTHFGRGVGQDGNNVLERMHGMPRRKLPDRRGGAVRNGGAATRKVPGLRGVEPKLTGAVGCQPVNLIGIRCGVDSLVNAQLVSALRQMSSTAHVQGGPFLWFSPWTNPPPKLPKWSGTLAWHGESINSSIFVVAVR